jgi:hypothetical protein
MLLRIFAHDGKAPFAGTLDGFSLKMSLPSLPQHLGSTYLDTIKAIVLSFFPYVNMSVAFRANRNNVDSNRDTHSTMSCSLSAVAFYEALLKYGIRLDGEMVRETFQKIKTVDCEKEDIAKTMLNQPKDMLASGFILLNENLESRTEGFADQKRIQMNKILQHQGRNATCEVVYRAICPDGFEKHKETLASGGDAEENCTFINVEDTWPVYAVLEIKETAASPLKPAEMSEVDHSDDDEPPAKKPKVTDSRDKKAKGPKVTKPTAK